MGRWLVEVFQPRIRQPGSAPAHSAEPKADIGTDRARSPLPFQSSCRSPRWIERLPEYWQRASSSAYALKHINGIMSSSHLCAVKSKI